MPVLVLVLVLDACLLRNNNLTVIPMFLHSHPKILITQIQLWPPFLSKKDGPRGRINGLYLLYFIEFHLIYQGVGV